MSEGLQVFFALLWTCDLPRVLCWLSLYDSVTLVKVKQIRWWINGFRSVSWLYKKKICHINTRHKTQWFTSFLWFSIFPSFFPSYLSTLRLGLLSKSHNTISTGRVKAYASSKREAIPPRECSLGLLATDDFRTNDLLTTGPNTQTAVARIVLM